MTDRAPLTKNEVRYQNAALADENEQLRRFVEFVNLWCYRTCSATEEERLSVIKFHPTARKAAREAKWIPADGLGETSRAGEEKP